MKSSGAMEQLRPEAAIQPAVLLQSEDAIGTPDEALIISVTQAELESGKQTFTEAGDALYRMVRGAAKADAIDTTLYREATSDAGYWAAGVCFSSLASRLEHVSPVYAGAALIGAFAIGANRFFTSDMGPYFRTSQPRDAYGLQCLRVGRDTEMTNGKVAIAIHPREYTEEIEPVMLTKKRMADALDTVAAAVQKDTKGIIGDVIIPASTARIAGLPYEAKESYTAAATRIKGCAIKVPYRDGEQAIVVPAHMAGKLAELARADKDALLGRVLSELAERFPGKREALYENNAAVVKVLHSMLERVASEASGVRTKTKDISRVVAYSNNADGTRAAAQIEGWNGGIRTSSEDVSTYIDRKDKFNPRIQQRTSTTLQETQNIDLRSMTGGIETMLDIVRKLNGKSYDKLQLIRVALELLEQKQSTKDQAQTAKPETLPQGQTGKGIEAGALSAVQRTALRRKFLGRTVLTAVAISAVTSGFMGGVNMLNNSIKTTQTAVQKAPGDSGDPQLWRVDAHGLAPTNPYWTQDAFYGYTNTTKWRDSGGSLDIIMMPTTLPDPNKPHITVSTMAANDLVAIPIEEGTQVSAVRALSVNDKPLELLVGEMSDGRMVSKAHNDNTYYRLEYDLTKSDRPVLTPHWPIQPDAKVSVLRDPSAYPGTKGDAAEYIRDTFTYDANPAIDKTVAKTDPELYLDKMYDLQRCKCDQCNTVAAIIESQKHPETNMAFVTGYLHGDSKKDGHSYLGAGPMHAWFNNDGKIDDATAVRTDSKSVLPTEMPTDQVDKRWTESQKALGLEAKPNNDTERNAVLYSLAALALAGAATLEARKKYMQRAVGNALQWERWYTAGADIDPRDAVRLLQWQAYARPTSPLPQLNGADGYHGESPDTIPSTTLAEVARGGFTAGPQLTRAQQRGLQNTAQALLHGRRHASQHVYAPKHRNIGAVRP